MGINLCHAIQVTIMINHVLLKTNSKTRDCNSTEVKKKYYNRTKSRESNARKIKTKVHQCTYINW